MRDILPLVLLGGLFLIGTSGASSSGVLSGGGGCNATMPTPAGNSDTTPTQTITQEEKEKKVNQKPSLLVATTTQVRNLSPDKPGSATAVRAIQRSVARQEISKGYYSTPGTFNTGSGFVTVGSDGSISYEAI